MTRRGLITLLGAAAAWPLTARAQQPDRMRRIGVLINLSSDNPEAQARNAAFLQKLQQLGWADGRNVQIDYRWGASDPDRIRRYAAELIALAPDVILASGSPVVGALQQATRSVPIVFMQVVDPVASGFVASMARPGGNITGFAAYEFGISGKWLELLKEIAPKVTRVAILRDPILTTAVGQFAAIQTAAPSFGMELSPVDVRDAPEIERAVTAFARESNGGLIVPAGPSAALHRELIIMLAARHQLPAVYSVRFYVAGGGLISYGPNTIDQVWGATGYVDRILKGAKPTDLPVQLATEFELIINLKAAAAIGLTIPPTFIARADEVIE